MTGPIADTGNLWAAVDALTKPSKVRLVRDDGRVHWADVGSLWEQLSQCVEVGTESGGRGKPGSRPPADIGTLALRMEIEWLIAGGCLEHGLEINPKLDADVRVPRDIRRLASAIVTAADPSLIAQAGAQLTRWARRIRTAIGADVKPARRLRGIRCIQCGAKTLATRNGDGDVANVPPVVLSFSDDGQARCATCECCGAVFWRGDDLHRLAGQVMPTVAAGASEGIALGPSGE